MKKKTKTMQKKMKMKKTKTKNKLLKYVPLLIHCTSRYPPLEPFEHYDHGKDADPTFPDLLPKGVAQVEDVTPPIGSEVRGVQLSKLTKEGKDQLALFVAQRKVVGMLAMILHSDGLFCH